MGFQDGSVVIWDLSTAKMVLTRRIESYAVRCLKFLPNSKFATGLENGQVNVWDIRVNLLYTPQKNMGGIAVKQPAVNTDRLFAIFRDKTLKIWVFDHSKENHYKTVYD